MKTSDKLLLAFSLGSVGLFGVLHLTLYAEYKQGHIQDARDIHDEHYNKYVMPAPQVLSLRGTLWVNLIPSDSFYIEFPRDQTPAADGYFVKRRDAGKEQRLHFVQQGDTVVIIGEVTIPLHRPFADVAYQSSIPQANVYCRDLREIHILDGQAVLNGAAAGSMAVTRRIFARNSTVWLGKWTASWERENPGGASDPETKALFDSLEVESENSSLVLSPIASIRELHILLRDSSELNDQGISVEKLVIVYSNDSRIDLPGDNLKKAQLSIH